MKKISMIGSVILLSLFYQNVQAIPQKPDQCPSVNAIKARGLDLVDLEIDGWVAGVLSEQYDSNVPFTFVIGFMRAKKAEDAKSMALDALPNLVFENGPTYDELTKHWVCNYHALGYRAEAWTPANNRK